MDTQLRRAGLLAALVLLAGVAHAQMLSAVTTGALSQYAPGIVAFSLAPGTYTGAQTITLTTTLAGGTIFYTTDGSAPTIASTRYTGPITVSATQTINAIAAVIYVEADDENQNTNVSTGTQYWKPWCYLPGCNPGGAGTPQSETQTFGITSPEFSGAGTSMELSVTSDVSTQQTNTLMTFHAGDCDSRCTQFLHDFEVYFDPSTFANYSASEHDHAWFANALGIRYMFGAQMCFTASGCPSSTAGWDFGGNSNVPWSYSGVSSLPASGAWNRVQLLTRRIQSEVWTRPCVDGTGSWPYLYYVQLILNGTVNAVNKKYCANADPTGWAGAISQHQQDIKPVNSTVTEYYSKNMFLATGDSTVTASALFTIQ